MLLVRPMFQGHIQKEFPSLNVAAITQGPNLISRMTEMDRKLAGAKGAK